MPFSLTEHLSNEHILNSWTAHSVHWAYCSICTLSWCVSKDSVFPCIWYLNEIFFSRTLQKLGCWGTMLIGAVCTNTDSLWEVLHKQFWKQSNDLKIYITLRNCFACSYWTEPGRFSLEVISRHFILLSTYLKCLGQGSKRIDLSNWSNQKWFF